MLTVPFGFYMRYYFRRSWWQAVLLTFGLSLFFELTQLSGLYLIYPRPYRLFDVDDLLINTTGGVLGFGLTPLIAVAFPNRARMDAQSFAQADRVGPLRRFAAWLVDFVIIRGLVAFLLSAVLRWLGHAGLAASWLVTYLVPVLCLMYLTPLWLHGQTLGKKLLRIRIVGVNGTSLSWWRLGLRQGVLYLITLPLLRVWTHELTGVLANVGARTQLNLLALGLLSVGVLFVVWNLCWQLLRRRERLFYEAWAGTEQVALKPRTAVPTPVALTPDARQSDGSK